MQNADHSNTPQHRGPLHTNRCGTPRKGQRSEEKTGSQGAVAHRDQTSLTVDNKNRVMVHAADTFGFEWSLCADLISHTDKEEIIYVLKVAHRSAVAVGSFKVNFNGNICEFVQF